MNKPFGKASTCLREAASAKAGANLKPKQRVRSINPIEFIKATFLPFPSISLNRLPKP